MKKRLFLVPLLGGFLLSSCSFSDLAFWQKKENNESEKQEEQKPDPKPPEDNTDYSPVIQEEFGDYKLAKSVEEGKRYILGVYRHETKIMRFFNGNYHLDPENRPGEIFPYYLGTLDDNQTEGAAEIEIKFLNEEKTEFSMQVFTEDTSLPWNEKYMGVYAGKGTSKQVVSIALLDSPTQTEYDTPEKDTDENVTGTKGVWKYHVKLTDIVKGEERIVYTPGIDFQHTALGDTKPIPKLLGTSGTYVSMDCQTYENAINGIDYDLAHLYEHK